MKSFFTSFLALLCLGGTDQKAGKQANNPAIPPVQNLFIITIDGFRWQELFTGADSALINNEDYSPDTATMKSMYWAATIEERRKKLLPFFWNVLAANGQVYGNRNYDNRVNVSNLYRRSYPGYSEMLTGTADPLIASNSKNNNPHTNVLEYLNNQRSFNNRVVVFSSWDVFPFILNQQRSGIKINSGYVDNEPGIEQTLNNRVQSAYIDVKPQTRHDELTFLTAMDYLQQHRPRVMLLSFGETDEWAHLARYDRYLEKASAIDKMIAELYHWIQSTPGYKNNTTIVITTDHGRGSRSGSWADHGFFINGSSQTWLALIGPNIQPKGEMKNDEQLYEGQVASVIANLVGEKFGTGPDRLWSFANNIPSK